MVTSGFYNNVCVCVCFLIDNNSMSHCIEYYMLYIPLYLVYSNNNSKFIYLSIYLSTVTIIVKLSNYLSIYLSTVTIIVKLSI
jgi:hypothetical protein